MSSAKQCRRAVVPSIAVPRPFNEWLAAGVHGLSLILVEPSSADCAARSLRVLEDHAPASLALISPGREGGWAQDEREHAERAGCIAVTLGGLTPRADAIAVAAIAIARFALRDP